MKKMNRKGFTLIELLAVIVILALLMAVAIPSVTKYISQSRLNTLVTSISSYISSATTAVNNGDYGSLSDPSKIYYIPVSNKEDDTCVSLERGGTDPFGDWKEAYVVVHYDSQNFSYDYYFTFFDDAGYGMELTSSESITKDVIFNPTPVSDGSTTGTATITKQVTYNDSDADDNAITWTDAAGTTNTLTESDIVVITVANKCKK